MAGRKLAISVFTQIIMCVCVYRKFLTHFNRNQLSLSKLWFQFQEALDQSCRPHPFHACVSCVHFTFSCASWVTLGSPTDLLLKVQWPCVSHHLTMAYDKTPPPLQSSPGFRSLLSNLPPDSSAVFLSARCSLHLVLPLDDSFSFYCRVRP